MKDALISRVTSISGSVFPEKPTSSALSNKIRKIIEAYPPIGDRQYNIQINAKYHSTKINLKPNAPYVNGGTPVGIHWITLTDVSLLAIKEFIGLGFILRPGIKINGTSYRKNFISADFIYLDIDSSHKIQASIESEYLPATYIYKSPSYDDGLADGLEKHRVFTRLSERVTDPIEVEAIIRFYVRFLEYLDPACVDPARIMYGSLYPVVFYDPDACINLNELRENDLYLSILDEVSSNNGRKTKDSLTAKKKVGKEEPEKILPIHSELIKKLEEEYQLDLNAFLEPLKLGYNFEFKRINPDHHSIVYKWVGLNPFSSSNKSGTSLVCSVKDGKIIFYNRARTATGETIEESKHGATIFDFVACVRQQRETIDSVNSREEFKEISKEVCASYDLSVGLTIDLRKVDIVEILENYIHPELAGKIYRCKNRIGDMISEKDIYLLYSDNGTWQRGFKNMCCSIFEITYQKMFGVMMDSVKHSKLGNGGSFEQFPIDACLDNVPHENLDYFYFRNGMFNYTTKELEPYTPEVFNFYQVPYDYDSSNAKDSLRWIYRCLKASGVCKEDRKVIYLSFLLTVHQKFHRCLKVLYLYGIKGSGKSTLAQIFCEIFPDDNVFVPSDVVRKADNHYGKFINRVTVWDEVINMSGIIPTMMSFIRNASKHGIKFNFEDKYIPSFEKVIPATIIFTGETLTIGSTKNVEGFTDRIVPIDFNVSQLTLNKKLWSRWYQEGEARKIIQSLVSAAAAATFNPKWIETVNQLQLRDDNVYLERLADLRSTADPFFGFIDLFEADPLFNGDRTPDIKFISSKKLKEIYLQTTGDTTANYSSTWNSIAQKAARKFKEINPLAVNIKKKAVGIVWYGIKLRDGVIEEYPQLSHF